MSLACLELQTYRPWSGFLAAQSQLSPHRDTQGASAAAVKTHAPTTADAFVYRYRNRNRNRLLSSCPFPALQSSRRSFVIGYILEDHLSEITCTVVVCFSAFLLAEATPFKVRDSAGPLFHQFFLVAPLNCGVK